MQAASDIFLGWLRAPGIDGGERDFYVRQLWDWKGSVDDRDHAADGDWRSTARSAAGRWPGPTRAPATGSRSRPTSATATRFDQAIAEFAERYADQNELDYGRLADAAKSGRIEVETDLTSST